MKNVLISRYQPKSAQAVFAGGLSKVRFWPTKTKSDVFLYEMPQHLDLFAARLANGENFYSVLGSQSQAQGHFAKALERAATRLKFGESIEAALAMMDEECKSALVSEFVNKSILALQRGTYLADQLNLLADSARGQAKVAALRAAGRNEVRMLIPLVFIILPVTILFAIYPSLQLLRAGI